MKLCLLLLGIPVLFTACNNTSPTNAPVRSTPPGGKVDLSGVQLVLTKVSIDHSQEGKHILKFDYTLENTSGHQIEFPCLYPNTDPLIQVNVTDQNHDSLILGRRPLDELTMAEPKLMRILPGKTTRSYSVSVTLPPATDTQTIRVLVHFHVPSRYDELRTSLTAAPVTLPWNENPEKTTPQNSPLKLPGSTPNSARQ